MYDDDDDDVDDIEKYGEKKSFSKEKWKNAIDHF